ncbi:LytTr DNA-binding domain-containing protein [Ruminococcaceae bacterium FB2012]|nr:LytTr DNA-binding domain-containing protein [Ruminococcaceae bacterium FB2012]
MKRVKLIFEEDDSLEDIEVTVRASERDGQVDGLIASLGSGSSTVTVTDENGAVKTVKSDSILLISVNDKQLNIVTEEGTYTMRRSLQSIESILDPKQFMRISRYELINLSKVEHYDFTLRGTLRIEFGNGVEAWASRRCIAAIRKRLKG